MTLESKLKNTFICVATVLIYFSMKNGVVMAAPENKVILDKNHSEAIVEAANLAGEIMACGLEWEPYYLTYMQYERQRGRKENWPGEKIAYIGAYFGASQEKSRAAHANIECPADKDLEMIDRMRLVIEKAKKRV